MSERRLYLRIFGTIVIGMAVAVGLIRGIAWLNDASGSNFLGRVMTAREALPRITQTEGDLVMFFGSSMVQAGFSARHFDREVNALGGNVTSWNFGFGGLNPFFQDYLSRRIREQFEADDRRLKLALIEFNPFQATKTRWNGAIQVVDSFLPMLASEEELWDIAKGDPERGALIYTIHYVRDNVSAELITTQFGRAFSPPRQRSELPEMDEASQERLDEISDILNQAFEDEYPDYVPSPWNWDWQGAGTVPWERPAETVAMFPEFYSLLQNDRDMDNDRLNRMATADILELDFEELLIERFIALVANFEAIADNVEIVLLPRNTDWIEYSPEVAAKLQAVIERIERETGVVVRNHQVLPEMGPQMFSDTTHLGRYVGDIPYTEYLAEQYAEQLIQP